MVSILNSVALTQNSLTDEVKILNLGGEPWHCGRTELRDLESQVLPDLSSALLHIFVGERANKVNVEIHGFLSTNCLGWLRINLGQVDIKLAHSIKYFGKLARLVINSNDKA